MSILRVGALLDVPVSAVRRALGEADTFRRAARAAGGRVVLRRADRELPTAGTCEPSIVLADGDILEFAGRARFAGPGPRASVWTVEVPSGGLPVLRTDEGGTLAFDVVGTAAGAVTEVCVTLPGGRLRAARGRRRAIAMGELLTSVALLVAEATPVVVAGAIVAERDGIRRVLAAQRGSGRSGAGRWELPGGKVELGETEPQALARELREELGLVVDVRHRLTTEVPDLPGGAVLRCYLCTTDGTPTLHEHTAVQWVAGHDLDAVDWLDSDRSLIPDLRALLSR